MKLLTILGTLFFFLLAAFPVASAQEAAKDKFEVTYLTVKVASTKSISTRAGSTVVSAVSGQPAIATAAINNGILYGGFDVHGVTPGEAIVYYSWTHGTKTGYGHCIVKVVP